MKLSLTCLSILAATTTALSPQVVNAANNCNFVNQGNTMTLQADCTTDETITIPDGMTLDGNRHTITAVASASGDFTGGVVENAGATARVTDLTVTATGLPIKCHVGSDRLRGILFRSASGSITKTTVIGINQGPSGCQEGNAIEVRNPPFDGTHPDTQHVEVAHNTVDSYQKTGIVANGDVNVSIHHNKVGVSATQENLAANSVQLGFGALGSVMHNRIDGNQWLGSSDFVATAILNFQADQATVIRNNIRGNSDIGIYVSANGGTVNNNRVFDKGSDGPHGDFGIADFLASDSGVEITNNKVRGFDTPYFGVEGGKNKRIPGPQKGDAFRPSS